MATNNRKSVIDATPETEPKTNENGSMTDEKVKKATVKTTDGNKAQESVYTAAELAAAHKTFETSYEIVAVALKLAGKEKATITEAKKIIDEFKNREVK